MTDTRATGGATALERPSPREERVPGKSSEPSRAQSAAQAAWSLSVRHPVAVPGVAAVVVRFIAAAGITGFAGYLFPDEGGYVQLGGLVASGHLTPSIEGGYGEALFHTAASFTWPITVMFWLFGSHVILAALWAALFGAITAMLTALLVGRVLPPAWAAIAGLVVALFPSQILWSSVVLRESMVWAGLAGAALGIALLARETKWSSLLRTLILLGISLIMLAYLREWTFLPAAWATGLVVWLFRPSRPFVVRSVCLAFCVVVPLIAGLGPAGATVVQRESGRLGYERTVLSAGAKSAFVHPKTVKAGTAPSKQAVPPTKQGVPPNKGGASPSTTSPPVTIPAAIADEGYVVNSGLASDVRALPRGVVAFLLRPFPWQHGAGLSYDFAALEEVLYYPLYVLALVGLVAYRRRREVIAFPVLVMVLVTGIAAEAEGNLGSAFRHRDQLLWAVVLLATLGGHRLYELAFRRSRSAREERSQRAGLPVATGESGGGVLEASQPVRKAPGPTSCPVVCPASRGLGASVIVRLDAGGL